jgi:hypothetical protein
LPAIAFHQHRIILQSNQLWDVDPCHCAVLHNTSNLIKRCLISIKEEMLLTC